MDKNRVKVLDKMNVKEAREFFKKLDKEKEITVAYLRYFDGWHDRIHCFLKDIRKEKK